MVCARPSMFNLFSLLQAIIRQLFAITSLAFRELYLCQQLVGHLEKSIKFCMLRTSGLSLILKVNDTKAYCLFCTPRNVTDIARIWFSDKIYSIYKVRMNAKRWVQQLFINIITKKVAVNSKVSSSYPYIKKGEES